MVSQENINEWKEKYGRIFKTSPLPETDIIYKLISRGDYMDILGQQMMGEVSDPELETVKRCVLNDIDDSLYYERGGLVTVVYEEIMKNSGFTVVESEEL